MNRWLTCGLLATSAVCAADTTRPLVFAAYYVWYHTGDHPGYPWALWTNDKAAQNPDALATRRPHEPPLASVLHPLCGLYDSADPEICDWHVKLAQAAGIDAFLVSWWDTHLARDQAFEQGIFAAAERQGFKVAMLDERAQFHNDLEVYRESVVRYLTKYKDRDAYLKIDGRPVVYLYQVAANPGLTAEQFTSLREYVESKVGPVYWIVDKLAHDPAAHNAGELNREKRIPADWLATEGIDAFGFYSTFSHFRAHEYDALVGKYRYLTGLAHDAGKKMLLPVHPGHDNSHFSDNPYVMPRRDGQTLRDYLRAATDAGADMILVTSWNEWPESTVVEPASDWDDPYQYLRILAEWRDQAFDPPPKPATDERRWAGGDACATKRTRHAP